MKADAFFEQEILAALLRIETKLDTLKARLAAQPPADTEPLMTVEEAAKFYRMSPSALYRLKAVQVKIGRRIRISRKLMDRYSR